MENEVARCIAEGMAEMALNAIEKKLKLTGEDFSEVEERAGLGKPIVIGCDAVEAAKNFDKLTEIRKEKFGIE
jgi:hypothetical protein